MIRNAIHPQIRKNIEDYDSDTLHNEINAITARLNTPDENPTDRPLWRMLTAVSDKRAARLYADDLRFEARCNNDKRNEFY